MKQMSEKQYIAVTQLAFPTAIVCAICFALIGGTMAYAGQGERISLLELQVTTMSQALTKQSNDIAKQLEVINKNIETTNKRLFDWGFKRDYGNEDRPTAAEVQKNLQKQTGPQLIEYCDLNFAKPITLTNLEQ